MHTVFFTQTRCPQLTNIVLFSVDFKQIVIPTNQNAASFESAMQLKVMILSALFFVRH